MVDLNFISLDHYYCVVLSTVGFNFIAFIAFFLQLIIFMALAPGQSQIRSGPLTLHTETAIYVAEQMTGVSFNIFYFLCVSVLMNIL